MCRKTRLTKNSYDIYILTVVLLACVASRPSHFYFDLIPPELLTSQLSKETNWLLQVTFLTAELCLFQLRSCVNICDCKKLIRRKPIFRSNSRLKKHLQRTMRCRAARAQRARCMSHALVRCDVNVPWCYVHHMVDRQVVTCRQKQMQYCWQNSRRSRDIYCWWWWWLATRRPAIHCCYSLPVTTVNCQHTKFIKIMQAKAGLAPTKVQ